jgi:hypothetical protein
MCATLHRVRDHDRVSSGLGRMTETWKPVVGFEGLYEVSNAGCIRSLDRLVPHRSGGTRLVRGKVLRATRGSNGYPLVDLSQEGTRTTRTVHSLVAEAFLGPRPAGADICHEDGTRSNCEAGNLRYDTRSNNHRDKKRHGTTPVGELAPRAKLTEAEVLQIKALEGILTRTEIGGLFGVTRSAIRKIHIGENWRHV